MENCDTECFDAECFDMECFDAKCFDKISVIVPIYNGAEYLENCVYSICSQTYKNLEILLLDDGSRDNSFELCMELKKEDDRIRVVSHENRGVSYTRNCGLKLATGSYTMFVDADDWLEKVFCEKMLLLLKNTKSDIAVCDFMAYGAKEQNWKDGILEREMIVREYLGGGILNRIMNKLYRTDLIQNVKFPEMRDLREDALWTPTVLGKAKRIVRTSEAYYNYRISAESLSHKKWKRNRFLCGCYVNEMQGLLALLEEAEDTQIKRLIWRFLLEKTKKIMEDFHKLKDYHVYTRYIREAVIQCPDFPWDLLENPSEAKLIQIIHRNSHYRSAQWNYLFFQLRSSQVPLKNKGMVLKKLFFAFVGDIYEEISNICHGISKTH